MIYGIYRCYRNGTASKNPILCVDAVDTDEAFKVFGLMRGWSGYRDTVQFECKELVDIPKKKVHKAVDIFETYVEEE